MQSSRTPVEERATSRSPVPSSNAYAQLLGALSPLTEMSQEPRPTIEPKPEPPSQAGPSRNLLEDELPAGATEEQHKTASEIKALMQDVLDRQTMIARHEEKIEEAKQRLEAYYEGRDARRLSSFQRDPPPHLPPSSADQSRTVIPDNLTPTLAQHRPTPLTSSQTAVNSPNPVEPLRSLLTIPDRRSTTFQDIAGRRFTPSVPHIPASPADVPPVSSGFQPHRPSVMSPPVCTLSHLGDTDLSRPHIPNPRQAPIQNVNPNRTLDFFPFDKPSKLHLFTSPDLPVPFPHRFPLIISLSFDTTSLSHSPHATRRSFPEAHIRTPTHIAGYGYNVSFYIHCIYVVSPFVYLFLS